MFNGEQRAKITTNLVEHLVSIQWVDIPQKSGHNGGSDSAEALECFGVTGFVLTVRGHWLLATAGHIIRDLRSRISAGRTIVKARLRDLAEGSKRFPEIPIDLDPNAWEFICDDKTGLDFALLAINPNTAANLDAGGTRAISEDGVSLPTSTMQGYFMLGIPKELMKIEWGRTHEGFVANCEWCVPLFPVYRIPDGEVPDVLHPESKQFYARVPIGAPANENDHQRLDDIDGFSGGPIFGYEFNNETGEFRYWLIAIQGGWVRDRRILSASLMFPVVEVIGSTIDRCLKPSA